MKISIHQPAYLPWLGYFDKLSNCDVFVYLDKTQFQKGSFQNRNYIRSKSNRLMLTVPVLSKKKDTFIYLDELEINNNLNWQRKHFISIKQSYTKSQNYNYLINKLEKFYNQKYLYLNDLCWEMLIFFAKELKIKTKIIKLSDLPEFNSLKSDLILDICRYFKCDVYLSGIKGFDYLNLNDFKRNNIIVERQNFKHPIYKQTYEGFFENLGIIDYMFNK